MIYEKRQTVKTSQKHFCIHTAVIICTSIHGTSSMYTKVFFQVLKQWSFFINYITIVWQKWSLIPNQVTFIIHMYTYHECLKVFVALERGETLQIMCYCNIYGMIHTKSLCDGKRMDKFPDQTNVYLDR